MTGEPLHAQLRAALESSGLSVWELSRRSNVRQSLVQNLVGQGGRAQLEVLERVASALDLEVSLVPRSPQPRIVGPVPSVVDVAVMRLTSEGGNPLGASEVVKLHYWTVRELHDGKRHLVGSELVRGKWSPYVSAALVEVELALRSARDADGKVYQLVGRRHWTLESDTLFAHFCGKQGHGLGVDVTHALIDELHDEELARTMRATRP